MHFPWFALSSGVSLLPNLTLDTPRASFSLKTSFTLYSLRALLSLYTLWPWRTRACLSWSSPFTLLTLRAWVTGSTVSLGAFFTLHTLYSLRASITLYSLWAYVTLNALLTLWTIHAARPCLSGTGNDGDTEQSYEND